MANPIFIIAPDFRTYTTNNCGLLNIAGYIQTLDAITGAPKLTYRDFLGTIPNPTIMPVGADGSPGYPIYWKVGDSETFYTVNWYDAGGNLIGSISPYPITGTTTGGDVTQVLDIVNIGLNEQFIFWNEGTSFDNTNLPVGTSIIADEWLFTRDNINADVFVSKFVFAAGVNLVPNSPPNALFYQVTSASGDTQNYVSQRFKSVQTFSNQVVTISIWASTSSLTSTADMQLIIKQNFGTGGSTEIVTPSTPFTVTDTFVQFATTITIPSISGNSIGTLGDDYLELGYNFDPAVIQGVYITDWQFQGGTGSGILFPYIGADEQYAKIFPYEMSGFSPTQGTNLIGWAPGVTLNSFLINTKFNLMYCNYFPSNPYQFGATVNNVTAVVNNDATYIADGCILQSDGNNVVTKTGTIGSSMFLNVVAANTKFGCAQIVESSVLTGFGATNVSAIVEMRASTGTPILKMAIVGWSGATDQPTKKIVAAWNAAGTNPSLAANWSYIGNVQQFTLTTSDALYSLNNITLVSNPNIALLWWIDSDDMAASDYINITLWGINAGEVALVPPILTVDESLAQAQRYYARSYELIQPLAWGAVTANYFESLPLTSSFSLVGYSNSAGTFPNSINNSTGFAVTTYLESSTVTLSNYFPQPMFSSPSITFYNPNSGAAGTGHVKYTTTNLSLSGGSLDSTISLISASTNAFYFSFSFSQQTYSLAATTTGTVNQQPTGTYHYVANATIGV